MAQQDTGDRRDMQTVRESVNPDEKFPWVTISAVVIGLLAMIAAFVKLVTTG